jgi:hypothetical protein
MTSSERLTAVLTIATIVAAAAVAGAQSRIPFAGAQSRTPVAEVQSRTPKRKVKVASNTPAVPAPRPNAPAKAMPFRDTSSQGTVTRETYAYPGLGRRDPFVSLMNSEEIRPLLADLKLVAVAFDPLGRNSVAVLRDLSSKEQYRVKVGQEIGRMRVAGIREKSVVFGIEEFGYSRQETLAMTDSSKVRTQ